jgi:dTDP-4-dehydrorhamnose 3,5-epimerase
MEHALKISNRVFIDHRGVFAPLSLNTLNKNWIQSNVSFNPERATFRGLHFQLGEFAQAKLIKVITGRIIDFVIDIRPDSDNYLNLYEFEILPGEELYIPRGFAHGFLTLDENTVVQYLVDNIYNPESEGSIFWREVPGIVKIIEELMPNQPLNISEKDYFTKNFTFPEKNKDFL